MASQTHTLITERNGVGVRAQRTINWEGSDIGEVMFYAKDLRQERTGLHASIQAFYNNELLAWTTCNIERDEDRVRFSGSVARRLERLSRIDQAPVINAYPKESIKIDLDSFAYSAWPTFMTGFASELVEGNADLALSYLIDPFLLDDAGTLMYARPGRGKSQIAMTMAVSVDAGINSIWPVRQVPSYYINLERPPSSLQRRLGQINEALGLNPSRPLRILNARSRSLRDVVEQVDKEMDEYGIGFVILDSISRAGMGDLNDNRVGQQIINELNKVIDGKGASYLAIGHTSWGGDESDGHIYGSIQQEAGADVMLGLRSARNPDNEGQLGVLLEMTKYNDAPPKESPLVVFEWDSFGLKSVDTGSITDFPDLEDHKEVKMIDRDWIRKFATDEILNEGPQSVSNLVKAMSEQRPIKSPAVSKALSTDKNFLKEDGHRGKWDYIG